MGEAAAKEPTMEDILSSIRKIIAEEGDPPPGAEADAQQPEPQGEAGQALEQAATDPDMPLSSLDPLAQAEPIEPAPEDEHQPVPEVQFDAPDPMETLVSPDPDPLEDPGAGMHQDPEIPEGMVDAEPEQPAETAMEPDASPQMISRSLADIAASAKAAEESGGDVVDVDLDQHVTGANTMHAQPQSGTPYASSEPAPTVHMSEAVQAPQVTEPGGGYSELAEAGAFKGALMSPGSDGAVSGSFDRLKRSVMDDLEAKTESILRPMLREWLDENLPNLVERLVREEIERVARGN